MPLHELFYYDDIKTLKAAVNAMPRVAVFSALSKPNVYLDVSKPCIYGKCFVFHIIDCQHIMRYHWDQSLSHNYIYGPLACVCLV